MTLPVLIDVEELSALIEAGAAPAIARCPMGAG